jgi:DNA-binding transcriptional regulator/RsmH inhibitor MraZ
VYRAPHNHTGKVNTDYERYKGFHPYKMDSKYRVAVVSAWRPEPGVPLFLLFSNTDGVPMVKVLTREAYRAKVDLILNSGKPPKEQGRLLGKLAMLCREATLNEQGKLLIPKDLSEQAGITADAEVYLVGRGIHFEVWSKTNFAPYLAEAVEEDVDDDLGIF